MWPIYVLKHVKGNTRKQHFKFGNFLFAGNRGYLGYFLLLNPMDFEVVVYKGMIREKPSGKEEAREFIKG